MKKVLFIVMFCLPVVMFNGFSQTKQESIKELFHLMHKDSIADRLSTTMLPYMIKTLQTKDTTFAVNAMKERLQIAKELTNKLMIEEMALYSNHFSQSEIDDFIAFYKSPAGQKMVGALPEIEKELAIIVIQKYSGEILNMVIKMREPDRK